MTKFIIDMYNKYDPHDKAAARYIFRFYKRPWAIKEYPYNNGELMRPLRIEESENTNDQFVLLDTLEEAKAYLNIQRQRNMGVFSNGRKPL